MVKKTIHLEKVAMTGEVVGGEGHKCVLITAPFQLCPCKDCTY